MQDDIWRVSFMDYDQQARFDDFLEVFNQQRPHEALGMKCPAEV